jgi:hypothetical protein
MFEPEGGRRSELHGLNAMRQASFRQRNRAGIIAGNQTGKQ